jgi:hypothetical protein
MRIYEGSPRQDFEEVFRSIGAFLDQRGMKDVLLVEAPDGFIVQGLVVAGGGTGAWSESVGTQTKETLTFLDDDIARFMEEATARRGRTPPPPPHEAGYYETAFRVLGRYMDQQKPKDVFFFEQEGAFVLRLLMSGRWQQAPARRVHRRHRGHDASGPVAAHRSRTSQAPPSPSHRSHGTRRSIHEGTQDGRSRTGITLAALIIILPRSRPDSSSA